LIVVEKQTHERKIKACVFRFTCNLNLE